jgi:hypothetical protein
MATSPAQMLDAHITKIKHTAQIYRSAPLGNSPGALNEYLAALEALAEFVSAKSGVEKLVPEITAARQRLIAGRKPGAKSHVTGRVLPFVARAQSSGSSAPFPAA